MNQILTAKNIFKRFSPRPEDEVLKGLSLDVYSGEILAVVGASGVGKSTLLNILGLLDRPTSGEIRYYGNAGEYKGKNLWLLSRKDQARMRNRCFGFIFQLYHLLPDLTVLENVMLPALISAGFLKWYQEKKTSRRKAFELLTHVGISHRAHAEPRNLSGGEKQRAAIARSLITDPEIVLCDEPTGNLDMETSQKIHTLLWRLNKELKVTFIIVTHDIDLPTNADRTLHMVDGKFRP